MEHCFTWLRDLDTKKIEEEVYGELCKVRMEKIKWSEKVTNEQDLERIGEKRTLLNILRKKDNWIGLILRRNYLLHDVIEGQMTEVKRSRKKKNTAS